MGYVLRRISFLLLFSLGFWAAAQVDRPALNIPGMGPDTTWRLIMPFDIAPLDTLVMRAVAYSPLLQSQEAVVEEAVLLKEIEGRKWMDMTKVFGNTSYGNGQYLTLLSNGDGGGGNTLAIRENLFFNVGLTMTVSPWDIITLKRRMQVMDAGIYQAQFEKQVIEDRVIEAVIERYEALMLAIELQGISLEVLQNQEISAQLAQRYFELGDISFDEYARIQELKTRAKKDFVTTKSEVKQAYLLLKMIVGAELH